MAEIISKIVLTGGPCAGKTTALTKIEQYLTDRGYRVFVIGESATELIKGGIRPFGKDAFDMVEFQNIILKYQMEKEKIYEQAVTLLPDNQKCVFIYDRGIMDNKAYVTEEQFKKILKIHNLKEIDLIDRYDMVIHLVTAADGCSQYYTLENNQARSETVEEAINLDKKTMSAWLGHKNLVVIDNSTDFDKKMNKVLENIDGCIKFPYSIRYQKKYKIDLDDLAISFLEKIKTSKINILQTYLIDENNQYEKRLRKRTLNQENSYYYTIQKYVNNDEKEIVVDKKISEKEYELLLKTSDKIVEIEKIRYTFIYEKQYFSLDIYQDGNAILEINQLNKNIEVKLPEFLNILDVTEINDYKNYNMARNSQKTKKINFNL